MSHLNETPDGRILRGVGGFYYVWDGTKIHECKARGRFRKEKRTPMVGDMVQFIPQRTGERESYGYIEELLPRQSELKRPPLANIDQLIAVVATASPAPDLLLMDKLLVDAQEAEMLAVVCINKTDMKDGEKIARQIADAYAATGYPCLCVSAQTGDGLSQLEEHLQGHITALAGQSGVGKSSLINALHPIFALETGEVSRNARGRHTTRHSELLRLPGGGLLADTPGFSLLDTKGSDPLFLKDAYPEFRPYEGKCRFDGCTHRAEPNCAVKEALAQGKVSQGRHERYVAIFAERKERWDRRYD